MVSTPLKNISQLGLLFPIYGKIKMFQNTNQWWFCWTKRIFEPSPLYWLYTNSSNPLKKIENPKHWKSHLPKQLKLIIWTFPGSFEVNYYIPHHIPCWRMPHLPKKHPNASNLDPGHPQSEVQVAAETSWSLLGHLPAEFSQGGIPKSPWVSNKNGNPRMVNDHVRNRLIGGTASIYKAYF